MSVLVVLRHCTILDYLPYQSSNLGSMNYWIQTFLSDILGSIAVPFFFIVSGFFLGIKQYPYISLLKKKYLSLVLPYFLWSAISFIVMFGIQLFPIVKSYFNSDLIVEQSFLKNLFDFIDAKYVGQFWYIQNLIILFIISPILLWIIRKISCVFLIFLFIMSTLGLFANSTLLSSSSILYFTLGLFFSNHLELLKRKYSNRYIGVFNLLFFVFALLLILYKGTLELKLNDWNFLSVFIIPIGLFVFWITYDIVESAVWKFRYNQIYYYSFFIYAVHGSLLVNGVKKVLVSIVPVSGIGFLTAYFFSFLIVLFLCIFILYILKHRITRLLSLLMGNRFF